MAAPAVSESGDALAHQSRIVENVIDKHTTNLIRIFGSDMTYFSGRFIELGFITRDASKHIHGMGSGERGSHLLDLLVTNCRISPDKKQWFDKFVYVFLSEAAYKHIANSMTKDLEKMLPGSQDDNTLSSSPQQQGTQFCSVPRQEGTQLSSVPQQQGTQFCSVPRQEGTQLSSVPQQQGTQISSTPRQEGTQLSSVPQQQHNQSPEKMLPGSQDDNTLSSSHHRKRKKAEFDEESSSSSMETISPLSSSPSSSDSEEQYQKKRRKKKKHSRPSGSKYKGRSSKHLNRCESTDSDSSGSSSEPRTRKKKKYSKSHRKKEKSCRESDKKLRKVFKNHFGTLCCVINNPILVAQVLRGKGLLSSSKMDKISSSRQEKVVNLVHAVERKVKSNPDHLYVFIDILMQDITLQEVGKALWMEAGTCMCT